MQLVCNETDVAEIELEVTRTNHAWQHLVHLISSFACFLFDCECVAAFDLPPRDGMY